MCLPKEPKIKDFADWRFDGASTGQARGHDFECILRPVRVYRDPLRGDGHHIVLCEVCDSGGNTHESNRRALLRAAINAVGDDVAPWLGYEQKYTLYRHGRSRGYLENGIPALDQTHYCGVGCQRVFGRDIAEAHAKACMTAGILLTGINADRIPGRWEFQLGYRGIEGEACDALSVADDLWLARYLLNLVGEQHCVHASFASTPGQGDRGDARMHVNFSTAYTRDPRCGLSAIQTIVNTLESRRHDHIAKYSNHPQPRYLTAHAACESKTQGGSLLCIPLQVANKGYGYLKDRRPAANADPYQIGIYLICAVLKGTKEGNF